MKYSKEIKLNNSITSGWSIVLWLLAHILYGYLFMEVYYKIEKNGPGFDVLLIFYFIAVALFFASLINLQQLFNVKADEEQNNILKKDFPDTHKVYYSSYDNGISKPLAYLIPGILYISGFSLMCNVFVTWINEGVAGFNYEAGNLTVALFTSVIVFVFTIKFMFNRFTKLSGFVGIYQLGLVFRQNIHNHYIPYSSLHSIIKIIPVQKVSHLQFNLKNSGSVQIWLEPYKNKAEEIVLLIEKNTGKSGHVTGIKINNKPLFRFNRPTTMTRSSRWR